MRGSSLSFLFATVGTLMIVAACGPNEKRATIAPPEATPLSAYVQAVTSCRDGLRPTLAVSVGSPQQKLSVMSCQIVVGPDGKVSRQLLPSPVSYRISKKDSVQSSSANDQTDDAGSSSTEPGPTNPIVATISMSIGLDIPASLSNDEQAAFATRISQECGQATTDIFERSSLKAFGRLSFAPRIRFVKLAKASDPVQKFDQVLPLKQIKVGNDVGYVMTDASDGTDEVFFPTGKGSDSADCQKAIDTRASWSVRAEACKRAQDASATVNEPFCAAFARKVSSWLGLSDLSSEMLKCGASKDVVAKVANPKQPVSTFVSAQAKGSDYLEKAQLNERDLRTLLAPACPAVKALPQ